MSFWTRIFGKRKITFMGRAGIKFLSDDTATYLIDSEFLANGDLVLFENRVENMNSEVALLFEKKRLIFIEVTTELNRKGRKYRIMTEEEMVKNMSYEELLGGNVPE